MSNWGEGSPHYEVVEYIMLGLSSFGPYLHNVSNNSVYVKFSKLPNGLTHKLRVSDHDGKEKYAYKWQFRVGGLHTVRDWKKYSRYFDEEDKLIDAFIGYYRTVEQNMTKTQRATWPSIEED